MCARAADGGRSHSTCRIRKRGRLRRRARRLDDLQHRRRPLGRRELEADEPARRPGGRGGFSDVDAYRLSGSAEEIWAVPLTGATAVRLRDGVSQTVQFTLRIDAKEAIHDTQGGLFYPQAVAVVGADDRWLLGTAAFGTHYLDENEDTVAGRLVAVRHTRGEWTCTWGPFHREQFDGAFVDAVPDGDGGLWAATAHGTLWHLGDGRWTRQRLPADEGAEPNVNDLVVGGDQIYALGWVASQGRFHGALWRAG
nr:hypothetical protein GCM10020093_043830 [Planobispora longispora]